MAEWRQVVKTDIAMMPRTGWRGRMDALRWLLTGKAPPMVETPLTMSVWVKGDEDVRLDLSSASVLAVRDHQL